jgi:hypothetical protein
VEKKIMGFYKLYPTKDSYISNASRQDFPKLYASSSNFGASPSLRVMAAKDRIITGSLEWARSLVEFNITDLSGKIYSDKTIPSSSVSYYLKMYNLAHDDIVPTSYELYVFPLSRSFSEGRGIDDDNFEDYGWVNWLSASSTQLWSHTGSDYVSGSEYGSGSQAFDAGTEDLFVDVTKVVNNWLSSSIGNTTTNYNIPNCGFLVKLGDTEENNSVDYYTKMFHSRHSKYIDKLPCLEARWDDSFRDNRGNFAFNKTNTLYFKYFQRTLIVIQLIQ